MKFLTCFVVFTVFVSTACTFSIVGKVLNKLNQIQDVKKDVKAATQEIKFEENGHKNASHGFVPSQIKCKFQSKRHFLIYCLNLNPIVSPTQLHRLKSVIHAQAPQNAFQPFNVPHT